MVPYKQTLNYDNNNYNHIGLSQEECSSMMNFTLIPIPGIIAQLGRLTSASMQQPLNSALTWPRGLSSKMKGTSTKFKFDMEITTLLKNPLSFKKSLQQINRQLAKVLKRIYINSDLILLQLKEAWAHWQQTIKWFEEMQPNEYSNQLTQDKTDKVITSLNGLKEAFIKILKLSNQNLKELQKLANMTNVFAESIYNIRSAKVNYVNSILREQLDAKINRKNELRTEVMSLKEEREQLDFNLTQSENILNKSLGRLMHLVRKQQKNPKFRDCLENQLKNWNTTDDFYVTCGAKSSRLERNQMREARVAKFTWQTFIQDLNNIKNDLEHTEGMLRNLSLSVELLEKKKNILEQDISFLSSSKILMDELENNIEELMFGGWNALVSLCKEIQHIIFKVTTSLQKSTSNTLVNLRSARKTTGEINQQLITTTTKKISSVGIAISVYVVAYEIDLASLVTQLEQMAVKSDENIIVLEDQLINACDNLSREIGTVVAKIQSDECMSVKIHG